MLKSVELRDVVSIHYDGEPHPAVVLHRIDGFAVIIISGTGQHHAGHRNILIDDKKRAGKSMMLTKPTYFYGRSIKMVPVSALSAWRNGKAKCPPDQTRVLLELGKEWLVESQHKEAGSLLSALQ